MSVAMSESEVRFEFVGKLGEEFVERFRRGERPRIREYADQYPDYAAEIEEVFPALAMMEDLAPERTEDLVPARAASPAALGGLTVQRLGDYRIIREVGRGGMGIVYEAEQVSLGRHVALKVLPKELLDNPKQRSRFEREAKAAARLHHTNIVPVFGVGENNGLVYYVMQFIQGLALDEVLEELKRLQAKSGSQAGTPQTGELRVSRRARSAADVARTLLSGSLESAAAAAPPRAGGDDVTLATEQDTPPPPRPASATGRLSDTFSLSDSSVVLPGAAPGQAEPVKKKQTYWESVARIGAQVASALDYAHAQGVLHRDIKPANLLLDLRGTVWVTDFGLAKLDDDRDLTTAGDILGTLRYMAPETFKSGADARSEVYSLGLTLYELLAFRPAFDQTQRSSLIDQVMNAQITPLGRLNPEIPADLQTIVHKAIDRDPAHRYQTAKGLADDLQRFVADEPIQARRISLPERICRWARHNRGLAAALSVAACSLLVLNIAGPIFTIRLRHALSDAAAAQQDSQREETKAREALKLAEGRAVENARLAKENEKLALAKQRIAEQAMAGQQRETHLRTLAEDREQALQATLYAAEMNLAGQAAEDSTGLLRIGQITEKWKPVQEARDLRGWEWYYLDSLRHGDQLTIPCAGAECVAWSPDGQRIAGGARDHVLRVWDAATGTLLQEFRGHTSYVQQVAWSPDGAQLATAGRDKTIRIWDAATGQSLSVLQSDLESVNSVCWSPDGLQLASHASSSSDSSGELVIWSVATGQPVLRQATEGREARACWNPQTPQVAAIGAVFDATTGAKLWTHPGWGTCWSPDGQRLAVIAGAGAQILSATAGAHLVDLAGHPAHHRDVAWSPGGEFVAVTGDDNIVSIWDAASGKLLSTLRGHTDWVLDVDWSPDGKRLATVGSGTFKIWDWPARRNPETVLSPVSDLRSVAWNQEGSVLALQGSSGVATCDVGALKMNGRLNGPQAGAMSIFSPSLAWHPASHNMAARREKATVLFDDQSWQERLAIQDLDLEVRAFALSPDGTRLATSAWSGGEGEKAVVRAFSTATGEELWAAKLEGDCAGSVCWSPDGTRLAGGGWVSAAIVDADTGQLLGRLPGDHAFRWIHALAWDPASRRVALACMDRMIHIFDATEAKEQRTLIGHTDEVMTVSWSPDGSRIASGGKDHTVRVWDAESGAQMIVLKGHPVDVNSVAWSPDGLCLASASSDGRLLLWDAFQGYVRAGSGKVLDGLNRRLEADPDSVRDLVLRLRVYARTGDHQAAQRDRLHLQRIYDDQWKADPTNGVVADQLASVLLATQPHASDVSAQLAAAVEHNALAGLPRLAAAWLIVGQAERAITTLETVREEASAAASCCLLRAIAQQKLGQLPAARESCERFLARFGDQPLPPEWRPLATEVLTTIGGQDPRRVASTIGQAAAAADLARLAKAIEADPRAVSLFHERGRLLAGLGRWRESADDYLQVVKLNPTSRFPWAIAASALLMAGDQPQYQRLCQAMCDQFRGTTEADIADSVCKTTLLLPGGVALGELPLQVLRDGTASPRWEHFRPWFLACAALISYREGNYGDAVEWVRQLPSFNTQPGTLALVVRAMAEQQLGQHEQAVQSLAQAEAQIPAELRTLGTADYNGPLPASAEVVQHDWLVPEILRRQAVTLIHAAP